MPRTETKNGVRNGLEFRVLNGTKGTTGRPPVLTDPELAALALQLSVKTGRAPRIDELVQAAGGCQRKRALQAIRHIREDQAQRELASQLHLPPPIEQHLRALMGQWLELASTQLASRHAEVTAQLEKKEEAFLIQLEERRETESLLRQQVMDRDRIIGELTQRLTQLEKDYASLNQSHVAIASIAEERMKLLDRLHGAPS